MAGAWLHPTRASWEDKEASVGPGGMGRMFSLLLLQAFRTDTSLSPYCPHEAAQPPEPGIRGVPLPPAPTCPSPPLQHTDLLQCPDPPGTSHSSPLCLALLGRFKSFPALGTQCRPRLWHNGARLHQHARWTTTTQALETASHPSALALT